MRRFLVRTLLLASVVSALSVCGGCGRSSGFSASPRSTPEWWVRGEAIPSRGVWRFVYPGEDGRLGTSDDVFTENELYLPARTSCGLELSTQERPTSFFVPDIRKTTKIAVGEVVKLSLDERRPSGEGREFFCTEYCGPLHSQMTGKLMYLGPTLFREVMESLPKVRDF